MNRISKLFLSRNGMNRPEILNIFFTAGYPNLDDTLEIILELEKYGVDMIEIGMPNSDPLADGPIIQNSSMVALKNGMNLTLLFNQIKLARSKSEIPLVLMGYYNQMLQYGLERFVRKAKSVGIDGFIIPDLPINVYRNDLEDLLKELDLSISFLVCPQTSDERVRQIDDASSGFVYIVADSSITGSASNSSQDQQLAYFKRIESLNLKNPRLIGFGIKDKASFDFASAHADGAIIGSAFIKALGPSEELPSSIYKFISGFSNMS